MEIYFLSARLRETCCTLSLLRRMWGEDRGRAIARRLAQLRAGPTLADLRKSPGHCREIPTPDGCCLAVDVSGSLAIVFRPASSPAPSRADGSLDWSAVKSITITEIVDRRP